MGKKKKDYFVEGLPLSARWKLKIVFFLILILLLNTILPVYVNSLTYDFSGIISIIIIILIILFSLGSKLSEGIVIALAVLALASNIWDFFVQDLSMLRQELLIGSIIVLILELSLGKLSVISLSRILKGQLGVK